MSAPRDDVPRRGESAATQRDERMSFDAALDLSVSRKPAAARPNDGDQTRPSAAPAHAARESGSTPARPSAASSMPPAPAARTTTSDENTRTTPPPADAAGDPSSGAVVDETETPTLATDGSAGGAIGTLRPDLATASGSVRQPAALTDANATTAPVGPSQGDASLTAGLIAASLATGNAAVLASAQSPTAQQDAQGSSDDAVGGKHVGPSQGDASLTAGLIAASLAIGKAAVLASAQSPTAQQDAQGSSDDASGGKHVGVEAGSTRADALPALSVDLANSAARDRLMQDFEQRFENSLARAVSTPGAGAAASPLLLAGLPPQPTAPQMPVPLVIASISTPLAHPAFGDDLAHRVLLFAGQRVQSAEVSLTPADLGPIRVSLEVRGQEAAVQFTAAHAATRSAIEDALPRLREMLAAQGLQLTHADVGDRAPRDSSGGRGGDGALARPGLAEARSGALGATVDATAAGTIQGRHVGLIDIRV